MVRDQVEIPKYTLPFSQGMRLVELGGGAKPFLRPNVDIRPGPTVDIVADLGGPLPLPDMAYDGVFCQYALEHVSWRAVRSFISEVHRILAPGGAAVFITANLLEQARKLIESSSWNDGMVCMVFGDNDYLENTHRCGFSPDYAVQVFLGCGFHGVRTIPHPACATDMIIEAYKSKAVIKKGIEEWRSLANSPS